MTEEAKKDSTPSVAQPEEGAKAPEKKSGIPKYVIFGGAGLIAVAVIVAAVMMLMGGKKEAQPSEAEAKAPTAGTVTHAAKPSATVEKVAEADLEQALSDTSIPDLDLGLDPNDTSMLSMIQNNLDFLDISQLIYLCLEILYYIRGSFSNY